MPFEVQRRGRDDPVGVVERRAARRLFERDLGVLVEEARGVLVLRPRAVRADRRTQLARLRRGGRVGLRAAGDERGAPHRSETEKPPARTVRARGGGGIGVHGGLFYGLAYWVQCDIIHI